MKLLIATSNKGKIREFREMLGADRFQWSDLSEHREIEPVEETGQTFLDNACLKASYYARALNTWAMEGRLESSAVSVHTFAYVADKYALLRHGGSFGDGYGPMISSLLRDGLQTSAVDYAAALAHQRQFRRTAGTLIGPYDALITPSTDTTASTRFGVGFVFGRLLSRT